MSPYHIECPSCKGLGYWPEARSLAYNGTCTICNGSGEVPSGVGPEWDHDLLSQKENT